jgi:hypothetical protein
MHSKLIATSAAILGLFAGQAAQADASAAATVNNIKFYVFDMDLNDGETATATFEAITGQSAYTWTNANGQSSSGPWNTLPSSASLSHLGANAQASIVGGGTLDSFILQTQAGSGNGKANSSATISLNFTVSKNAMLVLSADTSGSATTTVGKTAAGQEAAWGGGDVGFYDWLNNNEIGSYGYLQAYISSDAAGQSSRSGSILAAFHNTSGGAYELQGSVSAYASVQIPLAPIPEPETYAMLLAGLGVLGLLQRRRRV